MKFFLSTIIFLSCTLLGQIAAARLHQKTLFLCHWHKVFEILKNAVLYEHVSIPRMLEEAGQNDMPFLKNIGVRLGENPSSDPVTLFPSHLPPLSDCQFQIVQKGLLGLWSENKELQLLHVREALKKISEEEKIAGSFEEKYSRLYRSLSFLLGAALWILLI